MQDILKTIKELQATNSRLEKEAILARAVSIDLSGLFWGLYHCYNPFITFGVADKMVPEKVDDTCSGCDTLSFFMDLTTKLIARELTGNAARRALEELCSKTDKDYWNLFFRPILLKDMRIGCSETTVNKVLKKINAQAGALNKSRHFEIPTFECQLAKDSTDEVLSGNLILQEKLDGVRLLTFCDVEKRTVTQYTRNGKVNNNFPHIVKVFEELLPKLSQSYVFDGEVCGANFQQLMTQVNRKDNVSSENTKLALFDVIDMQAFRREVWDKSQTERMELLNEINIALEGKSLFNIPGYVFVLDSIEINIDTDAGKKEFKEFNKKAIDAGKEGIMIKDPNAVYECKRSKSWMKLKPAIEESLTVVSIEEGTGKNQNRMGNMICEGEVDSKKIEVSVGSGFSDEQRDEIWANKDKYIGMIAEIKADCLSKDRTDNDVWSMRFPRFKGFRGSEKGEKI